MRVLLFLTVFSFFFSVSVFSLEIQGNLDNQTKLKIKNYYSEYGQLKTTKMLNYLGYNFFIFNKDILMISNPDQVNNVVFYGNLVFLDSTLQNAAGLTKGDPLYADTLRNSAENVRKFYIQNGYKNAKINFSIDNKNVVFQVSEGKRFLVTDISVKTDDYPKKYDFLNPKIFDENLVGSYINEVERYYRSKGFYDVSANVSYIENDNYAFFININNPLSSVLSVLPNFHQGVSLNVSVEKGEKYSLKIKGVDEPKTEKMIEEELTKNLKGISTFYVRYTEGELEKFLADKGYINAKVFINVNANEITVNANYEKRYVFTEVNFIYKNLTINKFSKEINFDRNVLFNKNEEKIKRKVTDKLRSKGYIYAKVEEVKFINRGRNLAVEIIINEGEIYKIDDVLVNDKKILNNLQRTATEEEKNNLMSIVKSNISNKYYYTSISFDKFLMDKNHNVDLVFKSDLSEYRLNEVIAEDEDLQPFIRNHFFDDSEITKLKIDSLKKFLASEKNYVNYSVGLIPVAENKADIVISGQKRESNEIFGGFAYDDIEKFNVFAGYRRFDVLGSAHQFQIFTSFSARERSLSLSLKSSNFFAPHLTNIYSLGWKKRDESSFQYEQIKASLQFLKTLNNFRYGLGLYAEDLNFTSLSYANSFADSLSDSYRLIGLPLSVGSSGSYLGPVIEIEYSSEAKIKSVFQTDKSSFATAELNNMLKIYPGNKFRFKLENDFGYITRNDGDVPLTYRYTLGGPYRMKAFNYRDIGSEDSEGRVYGGDRFYYFLLGVDYELRNNIYIGPFAEYGNAMEKWDFSNGYADVGIALTADTVLGSISLSFAHETVGSNKSNSALYLTFSGSF